MTTRRRGWRASRRSGPKPDYHWSRDIITSNIVNPAQQVEYTMIDNTVYADNTQVSPSGVTVCRIVGDIAIAPLPEADPALVDIWWCVAALDRDSNVTNINPGDGQDLTDERILAQGVDGYLRDVEISGSAYGYISYFPALHIHFDIKQKVRLHDMRVSFGVLNNSGAATNVGSFYLWGTYAVLLKGDIT